MDLGSQFLLHPVEGGSGLEPFDLLLVESVVQGDVLAAAIGVGQGCHHGLEKKPGRN